MNSNATIIEPLSEVKNNNEKIFFDMMYQVQPELFLLSQVLKETKIRPVLLLPIIKMLSNLDVGNGFGSVNIVMRDHMITLIKGEESIIVNAKVTL